MNSSDKTIPFADRLTNATAKHGPLCLGIDPHPDLIPTDIFGPTGPGSIAIWGNALAQKAAGKIAAVKVQSALFERWGAAGIAAMEHVCRAAADLGLLVILDVKRGDIASSAQAYAQAYIGPSAFCTCDALTVNPYLGEDSLEPFIATAQAGSKGVAVLVRTSNPGASALQEQDCSGTPFYMKVAQMLAPMIERLKGHKTRWSGLMLVAGATQPDAVRQLREHVPDALFLVPGYGAQKASAADALAGFVKGAHGPEGGLVCASRSLSFPPDAQKAETGIEWEYAIDAAILAAKRDLANAL